MRIDHVEVALGHRDVHWLAQRAAGMMQARRHVDELGEVAEILDRRIAAAFIEIADEGWAIDGCEDGAVAADHHIVGGVPGILRVFARRRLDELPHQPPGKAHAVALGIGCRRLGIGTGVLPHADGFLVLVEVDAGFLKHGFGVVLDEFQLLVIERLVKLDLAADVAGLDNCGGCAGGTAGISAATAATAGRGLGWSLFGIGHLDTPG